MQLDNFRKLKGFGWPKFTKMNLWRQDKGQKNEVQAFLDAVREGSQPPIPYDELFSTSVVTFKILESIQTRQAQRLG